MRFNAYWMMALHDSASYPAPLTKTLYRVLPELSNNQCKQATQTPGHEYAYVAVTYLMVMPAAETALLALWLPKDIRVPRVELQVNKLSVDVQQQ